MSIKQFFLFICLLKSGIILSQSYTYSGKVLNKDTKLPLSNIEIVDEDARILDITNSNGEFTLISTKNEIYVIVHAEEYYSQSVILYSSDNENKIELQPLSVELKQVEIIW